MEKITYFDHNSTTHYSSSVKEYIKEELVKDWENPSSEHDRGVYLKNKISESRLSISEFLNCPPKNLFFTASGSESINTVLSYDTLKLNKIESIISSSLEHKATLKKSQYLKSRGVPIFYIKNNSQGEIDFERLEKLCFENPKSLISLLSVNNETGVKLDIPPVTIIAKKYNCLIHIDGIQQLGKAKVDIEEMDVDFISFSGHKVGSLKGVGLLYARKPIAPLIHGGGQERNMRSGTYNFPAIKTLNLAIKDISAVNYQYIERLRDTLEKDFLKLHKSFKINCFKANRIHNTSNLYFGGISSRAVMLYLGSKGFCVSTGSACNSGTEESSHVIRALGYDTNYARSCLRVSLSSSNSMEEIKSFIESLSDLFLKKYIGIQSNFAPN